MKKSQCLSYPSSASSHIPADIVYPVACFTACCEHWLRKGGGDRGWHRKWTQMWNFRTWRFWGIRRLCVGWAKKWTQTWPIYWSLLTSSCALRFSVVQGCWVSNHRNIDNYSSSLLLGHLLYPWLQNDPARHVRHMAGSCAPEPMLQDWASQYTFRMYLGWNVGSDIHSKQNIDLPCVVLSP